MLQMAVCRLVAWLLQEAGCKTDVYLHNFRLGLEVGGAWFVMIKVSYNVGWLHVAASSVLRFGFHSAS